MTSYLRLVSNCPRYFKTLASVLIGNDPVWGSKTEITQLLSTSKGPYERNCVPGWAAQREPGPGTSQQKKPTQRRLS